MGSNAPKALRKRYAYFIRTMVNKRLVFLFHFTRELYCHKKQRESGF